MSSYPEKAGGMSDTQLVRRDLHFGALISALEDEGNGKFWVAGVLLTLMAVSSVACISSGSLLLFVLTMILTVLFVVVIASWLVPNFIVDAVRKHHHVVRSELGRREMPTYPAS